jgi:hypothetical protein
VWDDPHAIGSDNHENSLDSGIINVRGRGPWSHSNSSMQVETIRAKMQAPIIDRLADELLGVFRIKQSFGIQIPNWVLVLGAIIIVWLIYRST